MIFLRPLITIAIGLVATAIPGQAQMHWKNVDSSYGRLPPTFHVFRNRDSLHGRHLNAYYVSVKLTDKEVSFTTVTGNGDRYTPTQYFRQEKSPLLIVNGGFFSPETNENLSLVMRDGRMIAHNVTALKGIGHDTALYYYPTRGAFGIDSKNRATVDWVFTDTTRRYPYAFESVPAEAKGEYANPSIYDLRDVEWKWWRMKTAVGGGPVLIYEGKIWITNKEEQMFVGEEKELHARTAIGYTKDDRLIILVIQGGEGQGASLEDEARLLREIGCYKALNLSGGNNSCLLINGRETIKPSGPEGQAAVTAVFVVRREL